MRMLRSLGPGLLITAAFIGPGTIATATVAGAKYGFALTWALAFSILATMILQEMSARLGLVTRQGLGEALRATFSNPILRTACVLLVVAAIAVGNAAFEMGNITGAAMALESVTGVSRPTWSLVLGAVAVLLLMMGTYRTLEGILIALVCLMGVTFVATAVVLRPNLGDISHGLFLPSKPPGS